MFNRSREPHVQRQIRDWFYRIDQASQGIGSGIDVNWKDTKGWVRSSLEISYLFAI